ncbi:MAG TPA: hypothetical protein PLL98_05320 [Bacillota bacterium]|nr:hypothetical protein [Bacillota bacterium]
MATVKSIQKRLVIFSVLFVGGTLLTLWFAISVILEAVITMGVVSTFLLFFLIKQWSQLCNARLICENRILTVPSAIIAKGQDGHEIYTEETIVSTFGILLGDEVFRWGFDGLHGVRLNAIKVDRANITLEFGNREQKMRVKLLHGLTDEQAVAEIKRKLWHETGVKAEISDW